MRNTAGLTLAIVCSACVLSVDPVVSESGAVFDARLLGTWAAESDSDRATVGRAGDKTYSIDYSSDGESGRFEARLGRLGNRTVLDVWVPSDSGVKEPYKGMMIRGHMLIVLEVGGDTLSTATLDVSALRSALRTRAVSLAHVNSGEQLVLTGATNELRTGLARYIARKGALDKPQRWRRMPGGAGQSTTGQIR